MEFNKKELETIKFLINFYIMNSNHKDVLKDVKLLESKVIQGIYGEEE